MTPDVETVKPGADLAAFEAELIALPVAEFDARRRDLRGVDLDRVHFLRGLVDRTTGDPKAALSSAVADKLAALPRTLLIKVETLLVEAGAPDRTLREQVADAFMRADAAREAEDEDVGDADPTVELTDRFGQIDPRMPEADRAVVEAAEYDVAAPFIDPHRATVTAAWRDPARKARLRAALGKIKGVRVTDVDKYFDAGAKAADELQGRRSRFHDPDPWPDPVDGAALLDEAEAVLDRFVDGPDGGNAAAAVYSLYSWSYDAFQVAPNFLVSAPEKGSGKTTLTGVMARLVRRPKTLADASAAALFRTIEKHKPTMIFDEATDFLSRPPDDPVRGILKAAFDRQNAVVDRVEGDDREVREFDVFGPKIMNGINLASKNDQLSSRSVIVTMMRAGRRMPEFRVDRNPVKEDWRRRAARWANDNRQVLADADPDVGDLLHRGADVWRPLLAVADAAGGCWPARIRGAALALVAAAERASAGDTLGIELLRDCREVMEDRGDPDEIDTATLDAALCELPERPWAALNRGKEMTPQWRGRKLAGYGIKVTKHRDGGARRSFYLRSDFLPAWSAYLSPQGPPKQTVTRGHSPNSPTDSRGYAGPVSKPANGAGPVSNGDGDTVSNGAGPVRENETGPGQAVDPIDETGDRPRVTVCFGSAGERKPSGADGAATADGFEGADGDDLPPLATLRGAWKDRSAAAEPWEAKRWKEARETREARLCRQGAPSPVRRSYALTMHDWDAEKEGKR